MLNSGRKKKYSDSRVVRKKILGVKQQSITL